MSYEFHAVPATRGIQPLIIALISDHYGGKTKSALELATGIAEVTAQRIVLADTEPPRGRQYAADYAYHYVDMGDGEYPPERFQALLRAFPDDVLIIDSFSEEHEGPGGVVQWQQQLYERDSRKLKDGIKSSQAWITVKKSRNRLTADIQRRRAPLVLCVRAKPPSEAAKKAVWTAKTDHRYLGPCTVSFFLRNGYVVWPSDELADRLTHLVDGMPRACISPRLDIATGRMLAHWARGEMPEHPLAVELGKAGDENELLAIESRIRDAWNTLDQWSRRQLEIAGRVARKRLQLAPPGATS